jgi:hypothetical protein
VKPNSRETTTCHECSARVFFAITRAGARQCLDAEPHPLGTVAAYRVDVKTWWCRTIVKSTPDDDAGQDQAADDVADPDDAAHPLEERFRPHAMTCRRRPKPEQDMIPGFEVAVPPSGEPAPGRPGPAGSGGAVVVPFPRSRRAR